MDEEVKVEALKAVTLGNRQEIFRMRFRAFLATVALIGSGIFLWKICFTKDAEMSKHVGIIVGFVIGSLITAIISYYFGTTEGKEAKPNDYEPAT